MRELVTKEIDEKVYEFQQFTTTVSLKTLATLTKLIGEPLMAAFGAVVRKPGAKLMDSEIDSSGLAKAVKALVGQLEGSGTDEALKLIKTLVTGPTGGEVLCNHNKIIFDEHFRGPEGLSHLLKVVQTALEVQYGNFLGAVSAKLPAARHPVQPITAR